MSHTLTTCTFCGVGCGIYLEADGPLLTGAYPSMTHPTNQGRICVRGWHVNEVASAPDRLLQPLLRRRDRLEPAGWDEALGFIAERLLAIRRQVGPNAIGFLSSARGSNEENYLLQKLARAVIGTNNLDHGLGASRNNTIDVLLDMLGVPATTNSVAELSRSEVIVVNGVDLGLQLPTIGGRVLRAKLAGAKLIVIDPRRQRLAEHADCFLQLRPGSDAALYGAMAKVILDRGLLDTHFVKAHCREAERFLDLLHAYDARWAADVCGVPSERIEEAALLYGRAGAAAILFSTGVEAHGVEAVQALVNLALLTGNLGKAGAGIFALTEHNNLQGVCDMGMLPNRLPGYVPVTDEAGRRRFEAVWGARVPATPGQGAEQLLHRTGTGLVRALWLCRHDPVLASSADAAATLQDLDLVVVQHPFLTETAKHAHAVLPVAAFGEEEGTYTNTERRIQLVRRAVEPPTGLAPAWEQIAAVANMLGAGWRYENAAAVMQEIGQVVPAYGAASYENLGREYGRQWPCTTDKPLGTRFLFEEGIAGRPFRFAAIPRPSRPPCATEDYPFTLSFGHSLYYWHQNVLVRHSETLKREYGILLLDYPDGFVDINTEDARRLEIRDGARVRLVGVTGAALTTARVTPEVKAGMIFVPYFLREVREQLLGDLARSAKGSRLPACVRLERV
ncbi:MAG: molybdopterin oxidoreductase family protein [Candidatus Methylomirabilales bacterium]